MKLLVNNRFLRWSFLSSFLNQFGSAIYNLVFVVYVATTFESKSLVAVANSIMMVPIFFQIWLAQKADGTKNRQYPLLMLGWFQGLLYLLVAYLTGQVTIFAFVTVCLINILSDLLSAYQSFLLMPIFKNQVADEDLVSAYSLRNIISYVCSIGGQFFGIWLLTVSENNFALVATLNAVSFMLASAVLLLVRENLALEASDRPSQAGFWQQLKETYQTAVEVMVKNAQMAFVPFLTSLILMNMLSSAVVPIMTVYYLDHSFFGLTYGQTLMLAQVSMIVGAIVGNATPNSWFKDKSMGFILKLAMVLTVGISLVGLFDLPYVLIIGLMTLLAYLVGQLNPKMSAFEAKHVPEHQLAQVRSMTSMMVMIAIPLGTGLFSGLAAFSLLMTWLVFLVVAFVAFYLVWVKLSSVE